ncbi:MAG: NAD-dependent epimerase/dehydratase family protein [Candidatus Desulfofervidus auxilii]|nr:NAD-dependent epimerase/dehydratase family protein [Candidatus Desulfofervidus auxilii]
MIFVTGATGFVGNHLVKTLLALDQEVKCLVRPGSESRLRYPVKIVKGDIFSPDLAEKMSGCKALIHLIGIIREFPKKNITFKRLHVKATQVAIEAAKKAGIKRFIHMSALGTGPQAVTEYHKTKWQAERLVQESGLVYTIFRPSVIYGPYDHFTTLLARIIKRSPFIPIIGDGLYKLQPVHVNTVALAFVLALFLGDTHNHTYEIGGPQALTYREIVDTIAEHFKKRIKKVYIPMKIIKSVTIKLEPFSFYPLTQEMLTMLIAGNVVKEQSFYKIFPLSPIRFKESLGFLK